MVSLVSICNGTDAALGTRVVIILGPFVNHKEIVVTMHQFKTWTMYEDGSYAYPGSKFPKKLKIIPGPLID